MTAPIGAVQQQSLSGDAWQRWTRSGGPRRGEGRRGRWAAESYGPGLEQQLTSQDHWLIRVGTSRRILFEEWEHRDGAINNCFDGAVSGLQRRLVSS